MNAKFVLSKSKLLEQYNKLKELGINVSYSYKTNREVGNVLQEISGCDFSIHAKEEIDLIEDKSKIWFFLQAENSKEILDILNQGIKNLVVDNEIDLRTVLDVLEKNNFKVNVSLRMKFQEHRIGSGKYFVYGISAVKVNGIISKIKDNSHIEKLGIHIHRKSQNTSEWDIKQELEDSLELDNLERINVINFGGGLPTIYRSYTSKVLPYIFNKIKEAVDWLKQFDVESYIEPGRFLAAPCVNLETEIIQVYGNTIVINTTIYNCALDNTLTNTKMLIERESEEGNFYLVKGNSPTRDDIFRYKCKLKNPKVGDKLTFLYAGAYNYTTDFFGYKKLKTEIVE
jgi:ornithine decarboxylase